MSSHSSVGIVSRQWDAVDWGFVLCERRIHNDRAIISTSSRQCACPFYSPRVDFNDKASHHPGLSAPPPSTAHIWLPATFWLFPKLNRRWNGGDLWIRRSHCTQAQSAASHCRLTSPTGEWLHGCAVRSSLTGCLVISRPRDRFSRYSKWTGTFRSALVFYRSWPEQRQMLSLCNSGEASIVWPFRRALRVLSISQGRFRDTASKLIMMTSYTNLILSYNCSLR